eukprot:CAMPEP_0197564652 /NCGR_PEP_ID=MMETSP1320-20131121/30776_1 /TAXON_ID=91990 /ORGANISM="Bolidomonas sp., Strain RCC2347" /LENGTH=350 /DNA_ID=CAMNT_0043126575 /DNA_START=127 /DNA_END=1176 /DNA_ORIENTATION=+
MSTLLLSLFLLAYSPLSTAFEPLCRPLFQPIFVPRTSTPLRLYGSSSSADEDLTPLPPSSIHQATDAHLSALSSTLIPSHPSHCSASQSAKDLREWELTHTPTLLGLVSRFNDNINNATALKPLIYDDDTTPSLLPPPTSRCADRRGQADVLAGLTHDDGLARAEVKSVRLQIFGHTAVAVTNSEWRPEAKAGGGGGARRRQSRFERAEYRDITVWRLNDAGEWKVVLVESSEVPSTLLPKDQGWRSRIWDGGPPTKVVRKATGVSLGQALGLLGADDDDDGGGEIGSGPGIIRVTGGSILGGSSGAVLGGMGGRSRRDADADDADADDDDEYDPYKLAAAAVIGLYERG